MFTNDSKNGSIYIYSEHFSDLYSESVIRTDNNVYYIVRYILKFDFNAMYVVCLSKESSSM